MLVPMVPLLSNQILPTMSHAPAGSLKLLSVGPESVAVAGTGTVLARWTTILGIAGVAADPFLEARAGALAATAPTTAAMAKTAACLRIDLNIVNPPSPRAPRKSPTVPD